MVRDFQLRLFDDRIALLEDGEYCLRVINYEDISTGLSNAAVLSWGKVLMAREGLKKKDFVDIVRHDYAIQRIRWVRGRRCLSV